MFDHRRGGLVRFLSERRDVREYEDFPEPVLDATTAVEDRTFWENQGFDLQSTVFATIADLTNAADRGGASSITQYSWCGRASCSRICSSRGPDIYTRKAKEIIQATALTQAFPARRARSASSPRTSTYPIRP